MFHNTDQIMPRCCNWIMLVLSTLLFASAVSAQNSGSFFVDIENAQNWTQIVNSNGSRTLDIISPLYSLATIRFVNWSNDHPLLPPDLRTLSVVFSAVHSESAKNAISSCERASIILQAKPEKYDMSVWFWLSEANAASYSIQQDRLRIDLSPDLAFNVGCVLKRV